MSDFNMIMHQPIRLPFFFFFLFFFFFYFFAKKVGNSFTTPPYSRKVFFLIHLILPLVTSFFFPKLKSGYASQLSRCKREGGGGGGAGRAYAILQTTVLYMKS